MKIMHKDGTQSETIMTADDNAMYPQPPPPLDLVNILSSPKSQDNAFHSDKNVRLLHGHPVVTHVGNVCCNILSRLYNPL